METILTEEYKTYTIKVVVDEDAENPRTEWDNFGHMICFHNRYNLGDKHNFDIEEFKEFIEKNDKLLSLPLYLYDHSGITMNTSPFSCQWDSGQIGYIYVTYEDIKKEFSCKKITKKIRDKVIDILKSEVETYDKYLTGEVYGYQIIDNAGDVVDSCYGYYVKPIELIKECKETIDNCYDYQLSLI